LEQGVPEQLQYPRGLLQMSDRIDVSSERSAAGNKEKEGLLTHSSRNEEEGYDNVPITRGVSLYMHADDMVIISFHLQEGRKEATEGEAEGQTETTRFDIAILARPGVEISRTEASSETRWDPTEMKGGRVSSKLP
jgi:hypothetical protein